MDFKKVFLQLLYVLLSAIVAYLVAYFHALQLGLENADYNNFNPNNIAILGGIVRGSGYVLGFFFKNMV